MSSRDSMRKLVRRVRGEDRTDEVLAALGVLESHLQEVRRPATLKDAEFKVFSQFGEDGILQHLLRHVAVPDTTFVEIGVESYRESNTRFLAVKDNWRGLAVDGSADHLDFLLRSDLGWRHDVTPVQAFVTRENVDGLIAAHGFSGEIGLLSIDVDGVDYWIWESMEVISPAIVVVEFNSIFGPDRAVTVPYDPGFVCGEVHWSHQYFGASLAALAGLGARKGYRFVGASSNAVNAFFVRDDLAGDLPAAVVSAEWRPSRFLSSRDPKGGLSYIRDVRQRLALVRGLDLVDLQDGSTRTIAELYGLGG